MGLLDKINRIVPGEVFAKHLVKAKAEGYIRGFVNGLGGTPDDEKALEDGGIPEASRAKIRWMIEHQAPLSSLIPKDQMEEVRRQASQFAFASDLISDMDFYRMLPEWTQAEISSHGAQGTAWFQQSVRFLRGLFRPLPPPPAPARQWTPVKKPDDPAKENQEPHDPTQPV